MVFFLFSSCFFLIHFFMIIANSFFRFVFVYFLKLYLEFKVTSG